MKVFKDPIHGSISLPSYCVETVDTPEFQRLRNIKQLSAETVYPGATHSRFAHCIGVCYLAGKVVKHLKKDQPELDITQTEVKCVELAGLCHDLGHGPFSHYFEAIVKRLLPPGQTWEHEEASVDMLHHLNAENKIGLTEVELNLISDLISGKPPKKEDPSQANKKRWEHYQTRRFLYQIIANKENGIDVDKWDYFARDCHYLGISNSFDHQRIIPFMRVCECKRQGEDESGRKVTLTTQEICYRDKLMRDVSSMFAVRWDLHDRAYQHRVVKLAEAMHGDALYEYFTEDAKKESPEFGPIDDVIHNMRIYSQLDDSIVGAIARSKDPKLQKARDIIKRIKTRDLYQCVGEILDADSVNVPKDDVIKALLTADQSLRPYCSQENLLIINHKYDYGMKSENPLKHIHFYTKEDNTKGVLLGDEKMPPTLPAKIQLRDVRLYTRARVPKEDLSHIQASVVQKVLAIAKLVTPDKTSDVNVPHRPPKRGNPNQTAHVGASKVKKSGGQLFGGFE